MQRFFFEEEGENPQARGPFSQQPGRALPALIHVSKHPEANVHLFALLHSNLSRRIVRAATLGSFIILVSHAAIGQDKAPVPPMPQIAPTSPKAECAYGRTNSDCYIVIDRNEPMSPVTMQLYSGSQVTVILINPRIYESYTLDPVYPPTQAANSNDIGNTLLQGIISNIQKFGGGEPARGGPFLGIHGPSTDCPSGITVGTGTQVTNCFAALENAALSIYKRLIPCETPDAIGPNEQSSAIVGCTDLVNAYDVTGDSGLAKDIQDFVNGEANLSAAISAYSKLNPVPDPGLSSQLSLKIKDYDSLAQDLNGYNKRLSDLKSNLPKFGRGLCPSKGKAGPLNPEIEKSAGCKSSSPPQGSYATLIATKDSTAYNVSVSRPGSFQLNVLNLVTNAQAASIDPTKKKTIAAVNLNYADSRAWFGGNTFRWEGSVGIFFSAIPDRSFNVSVLYYQANASATDPKNCPAASTQNPVGTVCDNIVTQKVLRPSIVPFTALHYRISPDAKFIPWKTAFYLTGAVGYNVNTTSADFAGGVSLNWRSIMISPLWHFGHDVRLTNGFYLNESLGASFKGSATTQDYWRNMFAVGVSYRVPSLTGR